VIRPLRGQVVVREETPQASPSLWTPTPTARQVHTHTGRVLALGPPARTAGGAEVPHAYRVGDLIQFHYEHLEELLTNEWEDGRPAVWVPQSSVDGVWEESS
jgi:co-chaperonin GroES (HSP10)